MGKINSKKIFYGWFIVAASLMITAAGIGFYIATNSVFVKPVCDALGFSRGEFTLHRTVITLIGALLMPFYGKLIQRYSIKKVVLIGAVICSIATIGFSFCTQMWHFYVIAVINGIFVNCTNFMVIGTLISGWFQDKKGLATGIAYCGSGLGGAIMVPIVTPIIEKFSWQWGYRFLGVAGLLVLLPTIIFLVKSRPEDIGLKPYTTGKDTKSAVSLGNDEKNTGITLTNALKMPAFWMLCIGLFGISVCAGAPATHTVPYLTDLGYSVAIASAVSSTYMLVLTASKIVLGYAFDRFGTLAGGLFIGICCFMMPILALFAKAPAALWIYAVLLGFVGSGFSVPVTVYIAKYFGQKDFPAIFSICSMVTTLGASLAVPVMGMIYDYFGSYDWAWIMLAVCGCFIILCLTGVHITGRKLLGEVNEEPKDISVVKAANL